MNRQQARKLAHERVAELIAVHHAAMIRYGASSASDRERLDQQLRLIMNEHRRRAR